jgi:hypothetical protein
MLIYGYIPKSKKRKVPKSVQQRTEEWKKQILAISPKTNYSISKKISTKLPIPKIPPGRETPQYRSMDTGFIPNTKPLPNVYTGDKMMGIATLHKSNAVPVFTSDEAKDISSMRR